MSDRSDRESSLDVHGTAVPRIGFGTWRLSGAQCREAVAAALTCGYRHIDTAAMYGNEAEVGGAIGESGVPRSDLFVTTKVWRDDLTHDALLRSVEASVERLACGPVDLVLAHWPNAGIPFAETVGALNAAVRQGLARHIGVSNFPVALLDQAAEISEAPIFANQCEYHPGSTRAR